MATKVTLREKKISGGKKLSLYLDFYPPIKDITTGKDTRREFLGLHILSNPKNQMEKKSNNETRVLAENVRAKRQLEIQSKDFGFLVDKLKVDADFLIFFNDIVKTKSGSNKNGWRTAYNYLTEYSGGTIPLSKLDKKFCNGFKDFLLNAKRQKGSQSKVITQSSARSYYNKLKAALKVAYKNGIIEKDLSVMIDSIKEPETQREYLSLEEVQKLVKTPCNIPLLKNAALFSILTGLRFIDISNLKWENVQYNTEQGYYLQFTQQKTKGTEVQPISNQAFELLGERAEPNDQVFKGLIYSAYLNIHLKQWILRAGITKEITFHCFRHTFATLQLSMGTDIYTVSKLLGHRELATTQIYAKIVDKSKREAANKIKLEF